MTEYENELPPPQGAGLAVVAPAGLLHSTVGLVDSLSILGSQETTQGAKERDLVAQVSSRVFVRADPCRQGEQRLIAAGMAVAVVRAEISPNSHPEGSER